MALERLQSSSGAALEQLRSQAEQGGAQKVAAMSHSRAAQVGSTHFTFCAPPCSTWLRSCSGAAQELLRSRSRAAHPNLPSKLTPLAPLLRSSSGAAPLAIIFTCKIKLLRSQKQSSSPKNTNTLAPLSSKRYSTRCYLLLSQILRSNYTLVMLAPGT